MIDINHLEALTTQVRRDILRMVHKVNSGHPGGSLGCAEFFVSLFNVIMERNDSFEMDGYNEDVFFLSNVCVVLVIVLFGCFVCFCFILIFLCHIKIKKPLKKGAD